MNTLDSAPVARQGRLPLVASTVLTLTLAACGGSGGGGGSGSSSQTGTATINSGNAEQVATAALDATAGVLDITNSANVLAARLDANATGFHLTEFMTRQLAEVLPGERVLAATTTTTTPCGSGTVTQIFNDADDSGSFSTGDSYELRFACSENGVSINGSIILRNIVLEGGGNSGNFRVAMTLEYVDLRVSDGVSTVTYNGTITTDITYRDGVFTYRYSLNGTFGGLLGGSSVTYSVDQNGVVTYSSQGSVTLAGGGTLGFETTTPFAGDPATGNPSAGECVVYGASNSRLLITALDSENVQIQVDEDGDGTFETSRVLTWASLGNG